MALVAVSRPGPGSVRMAVSERPVSSDGALVAPLSTADGSVVGVVVPPVVVWVVVMVEVELLLDTSVSVGGAESFSGAPQLKSARALTMARR